MRIFASVLIGSVALVALTGCVDDTIRDTGDTTLEATFKVGEETFHVRIKNPDTIEDIVDVWQRTSSATIPNGVLRAGPGEDDHNKPWNWHMDPFEIEMAEVTIELCDGRPSLVEENLDTWLATVGRYCPWSAELIDLRSL